MLAFTATLFPHLHPSIPMVAVTVRQHYNRLAKIYDRRWRAYVSRTLDFFQAWLELSGTETVLDIACGTGELERRLLREHPAQQIWGVDLSEQMLAIAQDKLHPFPTVSLHRANVSALPFDDHQFDVVVSASAFHYFEDPSLALQEMKRVLKPDGRLVILDWCRDFWACKVCDLVLKLADPVYRQCYTEREFHHLLTTAGFRITDARPVSFGWFWGLMVATVRLEPMKRARADWLET